MGIVCHPLHHPEYAMRGAESGQQVLFSYVAIDARIPADHPLRAMKQLLEPVLGDLAPRFATMYAEGGRPSIPPERLLRALLLQVLYLSLIHISEPTRLLSISYAVFCLKKKKKKNNT